MLLISSTVAVSSHEVVVSCIICLKTRFILTTISKVIKKQTAGTTSLYTLITRPKKSLSNIAQYLLYFTLMAVGWWAERPACLRSKCVINRLFIKATFSALECLLYHNGLSHHRGIGRWRPVTQSNKRTSKMSPA